MKWYAGENLPATHARSTFSEAWLHHHYGMEFGERYAFDPVFRTEQDSQARRLLYERFGSLGIGEQDPKPRPHLEIAGHRFLPALLGCEILYQDDQPPASRHLPVQSADDFAAVCRPNLETNRWAHEFRRQAELLLDRYGNVDATINDGGPINVASNVFGTEVFAYLIESPPALQGFLQMVAELCIETYDRLILPYNPDLDPGREQFIGNCPVCMLAPRTYREKVLPYDRFIRSQTRHLGLHHCGVMDRYLEDYQTLEPLAFIEVGWGSNVGAVRAAFPTRTLDLMMINVYDVRGMSEERLRKAIAEIVRMAAPSGYIRDIWMADIGPEVPDEVTANFVEAVNAVLPPANGRA